MTPFDPHEEYGDEDRNGWFDASLEHVVPRSYFKMHGLPNVDYFCNALAAHRGCNSERDHSEIDEDLLAYRVEIHQKIIDKGYPHIPIARDVWANIEAYLPWGASADDFFNVKKVAA
jgi:hypothetical protein